MEIIISFITVLADYPSLMMAYPLLNVSTMAGCIALIVGLIKE